MVLDEGAALFDDEADDVGGGRELVEVTTPELVGVVVGGADELDGGVLVVAL